MLECLNIFGNAGTGSTNPFKRDSKGGAGGDEEEDDQGDPRGGGGGGRRWGKDRDKGEKGDKGEEKQTSLRLSYKGLGEPVVLL